MKAYRYIFLAPCLTTFIAIIFSAHGMEQATLPSATELAQIKAWAPFAHNLHSCLNPIAPRDAATTLDLSDSTTIAAIAEFGQHNPVGYNFLNQHFTLAEEQLPLQAASQPLDTIYQGLDFAVYLGLQEPRDKKPFISRLATYLAHRLHDTVRTKPSKIYTFLSTAITNKDITNRHLCQCMQPELEAFFLKLRPPITIQHQDTVNSAQLSPNGSHVVTVSDDETACIWDATTGNRLLTLTGHTNWVRSAEFSPDGSRIVTASDDKTARIWDATTGNLLHTLVGHTDRIKSAQFNLDGFRVVTASDDKTARIWDASTGTLIHTLTGHTSRVRSAQFSPDGFRVVTASDDKTAHIWDAITGDLIHTLSGHIDWVNSAQFSPDGSRIATASDDKTARIWGATTGTLIHTLTGHNYSVSSTQFSPDSTRIVTASKDRTARIWDAATGILLHTLTGHNYSVSSAQFSPDSTRIVTTSNDGTARIWDAATGDLLHTLTGHTSYVTSAQFSTNGSRIVTASDDETARIWHLGPRIRSLAHILLIKLIEQAHQKQTIFDLRSPGNSSLLPLFNTLHPEWQKALLPLVHLPPQKQ